MKSVSISKRSGRTRFLISAAVLVFGLYGFARWGWAQPEKDGSSAPPTAESLDDQPPESGQETPTDESNTGSGSATSPDNSDADITSDNADIEEKGVLKQLDDVAGTVAGWLASVIFFDVLFFTEQATLPFAVLWLVLGALYFTLSMNFINLRGFKHAVDVTRGIFDKPESTGEVTHFQALTAALSATVGLGNIAGVAIAISVGGPGATFWMILAGFLGMSSKFTECTLGQKYREVRPDGQIMGGAMYYLSNGLAERGLAGLGKTLAILFAFLCIGGSLGGGNAFQVNQSLNAVGETIPFLKDYAWVYGLIMMVMVGIVIIGGIRRIAVTAEKIVPFMCCVYVLACLWILFTNLGSIPGAFGMIISEAFTPAAGYGGFIGVLVTGFKRAAFSNEAGVGSAAIAHAAAKTDYPVREGIVALMGPFIDTIVICTMTALVVVITGAYNNPDYAVLIETDQGAALTSQAMGEQISWFPYILSVAVMLFAYSTMISWSYYGERCWVYLFGDRASMVYKILFIIFVFLGSIISSTNVKDLSDLMILGMAFPNILGVVILSGSVRQDLKDYWRRYKEGEFKIYK